MGLRIYQCLKVAAATRHQYHDAASTQGVWGYIFNGIALVVRIGHAERFSRMTASPWRLTIWPRR